jgi:hypothetical protein
MRPPLPELLEFLSAYDAPVVKLALAVRKAVLAEAPNAMESIYDAYSAVADLKNPEIRRFIRLGMLHSRELAAVNGVPSFRPLSVENRTYARKRRPLRKI